jgi:hypothetical protein
MVALVGCRFREGHEPDGSAPLKLSVNGHCAVSLRPAGVVSALGANTS